jgi:hypothetical protein
LVPVEGVDLGLTNFSRALLTCYHESRNESAISSSTH